MNEEKKLDEKKLEQVTGGELMDAAQKAKWPKAQNVNNTRGTCDNCANNGTPVCLNKNLPALGKELSAESCNFFTPKGY